MNSAPLTDPDLEALLGFLEGQEDFVFLETTRTSTEDRFSLLFLEPVARLQCRASGSVAQFFQQVRDYLGQGFYLAGWFAYEFGSLLEPVLAADQSRLPRGLLADLGVYQRPHIYDHQHATFVGPAGPWPEKAGRKAGGFSLQNLRPNLAKADYLQAVERIKRYIETGDTYQVNFTLKLLFDFKGSAEDLYAALRRNQSVAYGAYLRMGKRRIMSLSPELFFRRAGRLCTVRPMKGTIGRGRTPEEDRRLEVFLKNDEKNRSENVMIVDLLRNDLGRLARMGTVSVVSLFDVERFESLHQMTSTVRGELRPEIGPEEVFKALFPCGSVTGTPKIRTMEIIRELERAERGVYTGGIGYLSPDGDGVFNVPIRTVVLEEGKGEMGIGSGIVYDSDPETEWEECLLKGRFLTHSQPVFQLLETMVWLPERGYWLLDLHLDRLVASAEHFGFPADRKQLEGILSQLAEGFSTTPRRVRLTLAKDGRVETRESHCPPPAEIFEPGGQVEEKEPLPITFSQLHTDPGQRHLYHKTTQRELYDREREKAVAAGFFEVLFCNRQGEVTEGSITNVFLRQGQRFFTPPVACGLLNGVFRRHFLAHGPWPVEERVLTMEDVQAAEALYVGNSVRGLVRVRL